MPGFPQTTELNRRIPKQKFYENLSLTPQVKRGFVEGIKLIYWRNKLAEDTVHIPKGEQVTEIEVFEIRLSGPTLDEAVLRQIDKEIPYHILFLLTFEGKVQAWIGYKEASFGVNSFKVNRYYHTDWMQEDELPLHLEGLSLDAVYENLVRQIAGDALEQTTSGSLAADIEHQQRREKLQKEIARLEKLAWAEKQPKRKFELAQMVAEQKRMLKEIVI
ncbi:MAG: DUF4391 domain-containing protein [Oscillospiraceae bacterium]|nr:DUF4391 domain-containing protein [Oscillospiraceae bacterium]